jgi:hypothetical protein
VGNDNILVAADFLENVCLELGKVRFSALRAEVSFNGLFEFSDALSNFVGGLIRLPHAVDS